MLRSYEIFFLYVSGFTYFISTLLPVQATITYDACNTIWSYTQLSSHFLQCNQSHLSKIQYEQVTFLLKTPLIVLKIKTSKHGLQTFCIWPMYILQLCFSFPDHLFPYVHHAPTMSKHSICSSPSTPMSSLAAGPLHKLVPLLGLDVPPL